jgi:diguanylate cyclase (GGDEF)-like protein
MKSEEDIDNRRILLVDDNHSIHEDFRKILRSTSEEDALNQARAALFDDTPNLLEAEEFELDCVSQGQHALAKVQMALKAGRPYAVAFVDMRMPPGWDGLETIERLWEEDPTIQIVICTAYSDHPWDEIRRRVGRNDKLLILQKPFTSVQVLQLAAALSQKWNLAYRVERQLQELNTLVEARTTELQLANDQLMQANQALVRTVADLESAQAKISQQNAELERLASRDSLTGCLNRRAVYAQLETAFAQSFERDAELCCLMMDIDHFKRINDRFGHTIGDHAIQAVATCLNSALRLTDRVGRYGGEEFCLVLPHTGLAEAAEMAERLRLRVEAEAGGRVRTAFSLIITVSCGVSSTRFGATTPLELIDQADKALYAAKEAGRNCVMALDPIVDQTHVSEPMEPQVRRITPRVPIQAAPR